ncbi:MAG: TetR family transcriptional regulator [Pseudomonas sp.]|uniref:TetR family transcriptional regulator n=1 Tax=Pseudomonas sp. TaxID=306 RepID=UPI003982631C
MKLADLVMEEPRTTALPEKNLYGQKLGRKGVETRARLLRATENLLEKRSISELTIADIAAAARTSPAAFYVYFEDVNQAILAAAQTIEQITPEIKALLSSPWTTENSKDNALALVKAYLALWQEHHAILRIRNLAADEGDKRFEDVRHAAVEPIHTLLSERIKEADNGFEPLSGASAVLVLIERVAAVVRLPLRRRHSSRTQLINSAARLVAHALAPEASAAD